MLVWKLEFVSWCTNRLIITFTSCMFRLQRLVKDLLKQLQGQDSGQWANNKVSGLDRTLGEISRILEKQVRSLIITQMQYTTP